MRAVVHPDCHAKEAGDWLVETGRRCVNQLNGVSVVSFVNIVSAVSNRRSFDAGKMGIASGCETKRQPRAETAHICDALVYHALVSSSGAQT